MHFTLATALAALVATSTALPYVKDGESFDPDKRQAAAAPEGTGADQNNNDLLSGLTGLLGGAAGGDAAAGGANPLSGLLGGGGANGQAGGLDSLLGGLLGGGAAPAAGAEAPAAGAPAAGADGGNALSGLLSGILKRE